MALHPRIAAQVEHLHEATIEQLLAGEVDGVPPAAPIDRDDVERVDGTIAGVPVRRYRARSAPAEAPALVWAHGGGWQWGDLDMPEADSVAQRVAAGIGGVVVSVDYRLAPAHRHPAAFDDVVAVSEAVLFDGREHGADPKRVALGGASAGGLLAASAAVALVGAGATPAAVLLAYPVVDAVDGPYGDRHPDCPEVLWLGRPGTSSLFSVYLDGDPAAAGADIVPARAEVGGFPPTLVTTAECDALAAQGRRFAEKVADAGVDVELHDVEGVLHGYLNTVGGEPLADAALDRHVAWLRGVLTR